MVLEQSFTLRNDPRDISQLAERIEAFGKEGALSVQHIYQLNLVLDELLTNIVSYGYDDDLTHEISLRSVYYTHLTLPTSEQGEISGGPGI